MPETVPPAEAGAGPVAGPAVPSWPEPLSITVYPDTCAPHILQIYAGLYDLQAAGRIRLRYSARPVVRREYQATRR